MAPLYIGFESQSGVGQIFFDESFPTVSLRSLDSLADDSVNLRPGVTFWLLSLLIPHQNLEKVVKFEPRLIAKVAIMAAVTCAIASAGRPLLDVNNDVGNFWSAPCWDVSPSIDLCSLVGKIVGRNTLKEQVCESVFVCMLFWLVSDWRGLTRTCLLYTSPSPRD